MARSPAKMGRRKRKQGTRRCRTKPTRMSQTSCGSQSAIRLRRTRPCNEDVVLFNSFINCLNQLQASLNALLNSCTINRFKCLSNQGFGLYHLSICQHVRPLCRVPSLADGEAAFDGVEVRHVLHIHDRLEFQPVHRLFAPSVKMDSQLVHEDVSFALTNFTSQLVKEETKFLVIDGTLVYKEVLNDIIGADSRNHRVVSIV